MPVDETRRRILTPEERALYYRLKLEKAGRLIVDINRRSGTGRNSNWMDDYDQEAFGTERDVGMAKVKGLPF